MTIKRRQRFILLLSLMCYAAAQLGGVPHYLSAAHGNELQQAYRLFNLTTRLNTTDFFQDLRSCDGNPRYFVCLKDLLNYFRENSRLWGPPPPDPLPVDASMNRKQMDCTYETHFDGISSSGGQVPSFRFHIQQQSCSKSGRKITGGAAFEAFGVVNGRVLASCSIRDTFDNNYTVLCSANTMQRHISSGVDHRPCIRLTLLLMFEHFDGFSEVLWSWTRNYPPLRRVLVDNMMFCGPATGDDTSKSFAVASDATAAKIGASSFRQRSLRHEWDLPHSKSISAREMTTSAKKSTIHNRNTIKLKFGNPDSKASSSRDSIHMVRNSGRGMQRSGTEAKNSVDVDNSVFHLSSASLLHWYKTFWYTGDWLSSGDVIQSVKTNNADTSFTLSGFSANLNGSAVWEALPSSSDAFSNPSYEYRSYSRHAWRAYADLYRNSTVRSYPRCRPDSCRHTIPEVTESSLDAVKPNQFKFFPVIISTTESRDYSDSVAAASDEGLLRVRHALPELSEFHNITEDAVQFTNGSTNKQRRNNAVSAYYFIGASHLRYTMDAVVEYYLGNDSLSHVSRKHDHLQLSNMEYNFITNADHQSRFIENLCKKLVQAEATDKVATQHDYIRKNVTFIIQTGAWDLATYPLRRLLLEEERGALRLMQVLSRILHEDMPCGVLSHIVWLTSVPYPVCFADAHDKCDVDRGYRSNSAVSAAIQLYLQRFDEIFRSLQQQQREKRIRVSFVDAYSVLKQRLIFGEDNEVACLNHYTCRVRYDFADEKDNYELKHTTLLQTPGGTAVVKLLLHALSAAA